MTVWLEIPFPEGDLQEIEHAAAVLGASARQTSEGSEELRRIAASLGGGVWEGLAAQAFETKVVAACQAMSGVANNQADASRLLSEYAREWAAAHDAAARAQSDLDSALQTYLRAAPAALQGVASHLEAFLQGALDAVLPLASLVLSDVRQALDRISSWTPPHVWPTPVPVRALDGQPPVTYDVVLSALQSGSEWGVTHLLDAAHAVAHWVGGAVHQAIDAAHLAEQALASAVAAAQRLVREALAALYDAAVRGGAALERLAVDVGHRVFEAVAEAVHAGVRLVSAVFTDARRLAHDVEQVGLALLSLRGVLIKVAEHEVDGGRDPRRMPNAAAADDAETIKFYKDSAYQKYVDSRRLLCESSYKESGAPDGWDRLETVNGRDGFAAVVFRNKQDGQVVVAYRGTGALDDWGQNAQNAAGLETSQGDQALRLAHDVTAKYGDVTFTGHSLGGSLAAMASIATGQQATTFNAAGIGAGNYGAAIGGGGASEAQITNFSTTYDVLTNGQDVVGVTPPAGAQVTIASNTTNIIHAHSLDKFDWDHLAHAGAT